MMLQYFVRLYIYKQLNWNYLYCVCVVQHAQCGLDLRHVTVIELVGVYPAQIGRIRHRLIPPGLAVQLRYFITILQSLKI